MSKHTPGPWNESPTAGHETHGQSAVYDPEGRSIAIVYDGAANARLIAKAPELYEALLDLTGFAQEDDPEVQAAWNRACALLAEIDGEDK